MKTHIQILVAISIIVFFSCRKDNKDSSLTFNVMANDSICIDAECKLYTSYESFALELNPMHTLFSDSKGNVTFSDLPEGTYYFDIKKGSKNNLESQFKISISDGETYTEDISINNNLTGYLCLPIGKQWKVSYVSSDLYYQYVFPTEDFWDDTYTYFKPKSLRKGSCVLDLEGQRDELLEPDKITGEWEVTLTGRTLYHTWSCDLSTSDVNSIHSGQFEYYYAGNINFGFPIYSLNFSQYIIQADFDYNESIYYVYKAF